jgi:DNA-binding YbaB/EbfC family protein
MKNLGQLMKQAQQMQQKMAEMQAELESVEMTGIAGGGMVQLTLNGKGDLKRLKIDKNVVDPAETEVLEDLIVAAFNDARAKVNAHAETEMQKLTGGLALPGGMKCRFNDQKWTAGLWPACRRDAGGPINPMSELDS